jgi:isopropylmalate/homocitrate/citramalate synthase/2-oxo-4-hydroxy-4-carboxy--5-ureidoimidazoline (OHCU) decarboxylase
MLNPERLPRVTGSHNVSRMNFDPEVTTAHHFPEPLLIIDSTLRKSLFTAGHATSTAGFQRMAEALGEIGVRHESININWSGSGEPSAQEYALVNAIAGRDFGFTLNVYADTLLGNGRDPMPVTMQHTVGTLLDAGVQVLAPGIVEAPDATAEDRQRDELAAYFDYAGRVGVRTTITLAQVGLRDFDRMLAMANLAASLGAERLDLMDSSSSMSVDAMRAFVTRFRNGLTTPVPITMHMHDEFGLASAGAIAAVTAGASPDVSFNKVSYRSGFAAFEEVVLALEVLYGLDTGIHLDRIMEVSRLVARETGLELPPLKALTGGYAYLKHMPGDAAAAIRTGQDAFPPISHGLVPARMGQTVTWVWGGLSSDAMVYALAESLGLTVTADEVGPVRRAVDRVVAALTGYPRWLQPDDAAAALENALSIVRAGISSDTLRALVTDAVPASPLADHVLSDTASIPAPELPVAVAESVLATEDSTLLASLDGFNSLAVAAEPPANSASASEESGITRADPAVRASIARLSRLAEERFGYRLVIACDGLTGEQIVAAIASRLGDSATRAVEHTRFAVATILRGRVERALAAASTTATEG